MPATFGIAAVSIAGKARSYPARLSLFVVPACGDGGSPEIPGASSAERLPCRCIDRFFGTACQGITARRNDRLSSLMLPCPMQTVPVPFSRQLEIIHKNDIFPA